MTPGTHFIGGWVGPGPVWTSAENLVPTGIRSTDRPARSEPQYRLSYPGPQSLVLYLLNVVYFVFHLKTLTEILRTCEFTCVACDVIRKLCSILPSAIAFIWRDAASARITCLVVENGTRTLGLPIGSDNHLVPV